MLRNHIYDLNIRCNDRLIKNEDCKPPIYIFKLTLKKIQESRLSKANATVFAKYVISDIFFY